MRLKIMLATGGAIAALAVPTAAFALGSGGSEDSERGSGPGK